MMNRFALKVALVGSVFLATVAAPIAALAAPLNGWERVYYSDALHTTIVGEESFYCTGGRTFWWGEATPYYDQETYPCMPPPGPVGH
jgi:hypothetical protein